jgi:hypothetical protein
MAKKLSIDEKVEKLKKQFKIAFARFDKLSKIIKDKEKKEGVNPRWN